MLEDEWEDDEDENVGGGLNGRWMLGVRYAELRSEDFQRDLEGLMWLTYRAGFPRLAPYPLDSDTGWGCMLRCGQMMLANSLQRYIGRALSKQRKGSGIASCSSSQEFIPARVREMLLSWFADIAGEQHIFSIQNMCQVGICYDKLPGEWYGPNAAALVLRDLLDTQMDYLGGLGSAAPAAKPLRIVVAQGGTVYVDELEALMGCAPENPDTVVEVNQHKDPEPTGQSSLVLVDPLLHPHPTLHAENDGRYHCSNDIQEWARSLLLVIPVRLGLRNLNLEYVPALLASLRLPQSMGFIGGRPNHAMYFIGAQGEQLLCLDPHTTQPAPPLSDLTSYFNTCSCRAPVRVDISRIDPSLALCFLCESRSALQDLYARILKLPGPAASRLFSLEEKLPTYTSFEHSFMSEDELSAHEPAGVDEEDTYVFL
jgi:cysteine protease ATG4